MASQHSHRCAWRWTLEEKCLETIAVPLSSHCSLSWGSFPIVLCWSKMNNKRFVYLNHWKWMAQTHRNACEHNPPTHHILHHTSLHHTPPHTPYPTTTITTTPHSTDTQSLEIIREDVTKENVILLPFVLWVFFFLPHILKRPSWTVPGASSPWYRTEQWSLKLNVWKCPWLFCNFKQCSPSRKRTKETNKKRQGGEKSVGWREDARRKLQSKGPMYLSIFAWKVLVHLKVSVV